MKLASKVFLGMFLVLAIQLAYTADAGAVFLQIYNGDGAVNNPTVPPGGWLVPADVYGFSCLACHNAGQANGAPDMTSYLLTGHKNMLRAVQPGIPLTGPDGHAYVADQSGNVFDWSGGTINILGFCTDPAFTDQPACIAGGGVWIDGPRDLYYIFDGWMGEPAAPRALYDGSYVQGTQKTAVSYSCARCHTTGYTMDASILPPVFVIQYCSLPAYTTPATCSGGGGTWHIDGVSCRAPEFYLGGITWTPANTSGQIDFDPDGNGPAVAGSWAVSCNSSQSLEGIQCERCHDASHHFPLPNKPVVQRGAAATALCLQCHRQEHTLSYGSGGIGANIKPTPFSDNYPAPPASEPVYALPAIEVGGHGGYAPEFYSHSTGMEFLNSTHARFSGNFQEITDPSKYGSPFTDGTCSIGGYLDQEACQIGGGVWTSFQGGCTTCHDVHQSTVTSLNATPIKRECGIACHTFEAANIMTDIKHPYGPGTPLGDLSDLPRACAACHMPKPNDGEGLAAHIWRISTDPNYSTFPTADQFASGQKTANTAPDGTYTNAVWIDIDLACGQCHGGSAGPAGTRNNAPYYSKSYLAGWAAGMHTGARLSNQPPTASASIVTTGLSTTLSDTSSDPATNLPYGFAPGAVTIDWGDRSPVETGDAGASFNHTYAAAGTYKVLQTVTDVAGLTGSKYYSVTAVVPKVSVTVNFSPSPISTTNGYLYLKTVSGTTLKMASTKTGVTWTGLNPGNYKVQAYKSGMTFRCTDGVATPANPVVINLNTDKTVTCTKQ
ncbi:MAG: PKD domain-containing protein [Nitrospirae bacterium]|nr:PKD domain-containing protein [Nitrospirota bacterium]